MAKVYVKFPKTGLGNMLLVWANGLVFAKINGLDMHVSSWWGFRWGAILRKERKKRIYHSYFLETSFFKCIKILIERKIFPVKRNPSLIQIEGKIKSTNTIFVFDKAITHENLFLELYPHRKYIQHSIFNLLQENKKKQFKELEHPVIAVHIRRGDFKIANQITPLSYFINAIQMIRNTSGKDLPATVFTDADENELAELLQLPAIKLSEEKADILDILQMSTSKILVLSKSSTFSYWGAFLSDALVVMWHNDWQHRIRPDEGNYTEIRWNMNDEQSTAKLAAAVRRYSF